MLNAKPDHLSPGRLSFTRPGGLVLVFVVWIHALFAGAQVDDRGPLQNYSAERTELLGIAPASEAFHILWVTVDNLSLDTLGAYGSKNGLTPNFDALAARGVRFTQAFAVSPRRTTSIVSMFHSQYPSVLERLGDTDLTPSAGPQLADKGFSVFASIHPRVLDVSGTRLGRVAPDLGFGRAVGSGISPESMLSFFERSVTSRRDEQIFVWMHLAFPFPPATYHPGFDFGPSREQHYLAAVRCADDTFGRIQSVLRANKLEESTITVLVGTTPVNEATRGEDPGQKTLSDASLRVPMIVLVPGLKPRVSNAVVETVDILPTLLSILGKSCTYSVQGRSFLRELLPDDETRAKAPPRWAFAEASPLAGFDLGETRQSVRNDKWRLVWEPVQRKAQLFAADDQENRDQSSTSPKIVADLRNVLEEIAIFNAACGENWGNAENLMPAMSGATGDYARARWLAMNGDKRAREFAVGLLNKPEVDPLEVLRIVFDVGQSEDASAVQVLLGSERIDVRSLAGAFLAKTTGNPKSLDYALQGLRDDLPARDLLLIIEALGLRGTQETRDILKKFTPPAGELSVHAARSLALLRLGDSEALSAVREIILDPAAQVNKRPFIDTFVQREKEKSVPLLSLCLTDGDQRATTISHVIQTLETLNSRESAPAVARQILHADRDVRLAADHFLRHFKAAAGYNERIQLLRSNTDDLGWTSRSLVDIPGLLGSPLLPGSRLDGWALAAPELAGKTQNGYPLLDRRLIRLTIDIPDPRSNMVVAAFRPVAQDNTPASEIQVRATLNDRGVTQRNLLRLDDTWYWSGIVPPEVVEAGINQLTFRIARVDNVTFPVELSAVYLLPAESGKVVPIAGLTEKDPVARVAFPRGVGNLRLSWQVFGQRPSGSQTPMLVLSADGKELARHRLALSSGAESRAIEGLVTPWTLENVQLEIVGLDPKIQKVSALIHGVKESNR